MDKHFIPLLFVFVVLGNLFGYWIKSILKNNDYDIKVFSGHFRDAKNIFRLAASTNDKGKKQKYFIVGLLNILSVGGVIVSFIFLVSSQIKLVIDAPCNSFKDFKSTAYDYLIVGKYFDTNDHSYPTLIIQDANGNRIKNLDLNFDNSGCSSGAITGKYNN
jgi:hypothetical protein